MTNKEYLDRRLPKLKEEVLTMKTESLKFHFERIYGEDGICKNDYTPEELSLIRDIYKSEYNKRMEMKIPKCFESQKTTVLGTNNIFVTVLDEFVHHYTKIKMYYIRKEHDGNTSYTTYETITHEEMIDILLNIS